MKEFLYSILCKVRHFLSPKLRNAKQFLSSNLSRLMQHLSPRGRKLLVLILVLLLVVVIGLTKCSGDKIPSDEMNTGIVSIDYLDVHKKPNASSRVLDQLSYNLEVEILESKTGEETIWGRIDNMTLSDGTKIKGGWIDLLYVNFAGDVAPEVEVAETEPVVETAPITISMGTITASKLNIRKGPGSTYETTGAYYKGDRVEILETQTVDDTVWGRTTLGWIGTGYVRMDGTYTDSDSNLITDGNHTVLGYGIVMLGELNVRLGPDTIYGKVGTITRANRYAFYELKDGWARVEHGWVSTEHFYLEGTVTDDAFPGIVNTEELNIRTGPQSSYLLVGTYVQGESIEILAKIGDWGYTDRGWVFLDYVDPNYSTGSGTVSNGLNIRSEPSADSEIVGTYRTGDSVTVLEVDGGWGRTVEGWINLKYVAYE